MYKYNEYVWCKSKTGRFFEFILGALLIIVTFPFAVVFLLGSLCEWLMDKIAWYELHACFWLKNKFG